MLSSLTHQERFITMKYKNLKIMTFIALVVSTNYVCSVDEFRKDYADGTYTISRDYMNDDGDIAGYEIYSYDKNRYLTSSSTFYYSGSSVTKRYKNNILESETYPRDLNVTRTNPYFDPTVRSTTLYFDAHGKIIKIAKTYMDDSTTIQDIIANTIITYNYPLD